MERVEYILKNLNCAHCASVIEDTLGKIEGVREHSLNFVNKKLILKVDLKNKEEILNEVKQTIVKIEPVVKVEEVDYNRQRNKSDNEETTKSRFNQNKELIKLSISIILFIAGLFSKSINENISMILFILAYIVSGGQIVLRALKNIGSGMIFDENFLMSIATIGAFGIGEYPEAAGVMIFYIVGEFFQGKAVDSSRRSIEGLLNIRPDFANIIEDGIEKRVDPQDVNIEDIIIVKPGERIPLDGEIVFGKSSIDNSMLTGESVLKTVKEGDKVLSGTINKNGVLKIKVEVEFYDSTVSKILDLVENAGSKKAKTEKFLTKFARFYTPIVVILAMMVMFIPPLFLENQSQSVWFYRGLIFLVVSCPCALVVSIPLSFFAGIGRASKSGILVKGSNYLEALNKVDKIVFDKTGTLTKGVFEVTRVSPIGIDEDDLIEYAALAENMSNHPIALSIKSRYKKDIDKNNIVSYEELEGLGVHAKILVGTGLIKSMKSIIAGNHRLMEKFKIDYERVNEAGTIVYLAEEKKYLGYIIISDQIKKDSKAAIKQLHKLGVKTYMLTGDNTEIANKIGQELSIGKVYSELLPNEKVEIFEQIQKESQGLTIFVGDGINDAPVLARADIGVAMGGIGSDAALEAADMVIMNDETSKLKEVIGIAKKTRKIILQNIVFSLVVKIAVMVFGVLGSATMWQGVFADVGVALIAVLNALRILKG